MLLISILLSLILRLYRFILLSLITRFQGILSHILKPKASSKLLIYNEFFYDCKLLILLKFFLDYFVSFSDFDITFCYKGSLPELCSSKNFRVILIHGSMSSTKMIGLLSSRTAISITICSMSMSYSSFTIIA